MLTLTQSRFPENQSFHAQQFIKKVRGSYRSSQDGYRVNDSYIRSLNEVLQLKSKWYPKDVETLTEGVLQLEAYAWEKLVLCKNGFMIYKLIYNQQTAFAETHHHSRCATSRGGGEWGGIFPALFWKLRKISLILEKKSPDWVHLRVKFFIWNAVLRGSSRKTSEIFLSLAFLSFVVDKMFIEVTLFREN